MFPYLFPLASSSLPPGRWILYHYATKEVPTEDF